MTTTAVASPDRVVRCRHMTQKHRSAVLEQCSGEALDPVGEILICQRHAALVLELVSRHAAAKLEEQP